MIYVIGGTNIDVSIHSFEKVKLYDKNPGYHIKSYGGVARNIAFNLGLLKQDINFVTVVGKDGIDSFKELNDINIDTSLSIIKNDYNTSTYYCFIDNSNNDMFVACSCMDIYDHLDYNDFSFLVDIIKDDDIVVFDTNLNQKELESLIKSLKGFKIIDPISQAKVVRLKNCLSYIDVLKPNIFELGELSGINIIDKDSFYKACEIVINKGIKHLFVTLNKDGSFYYSKTKQIYLKANEIDVVNTIGAGDAYMAGITYGFNNKLSIEDTMRLAAKLSEETLKCEESVNKKIGGITL